MAFKFSRSHIWVFERNATVQFCVWPPNIFGIRILCQALCVSGGYLGPMAKGNPEDWGQPQGSLLRDGRRQLALPEVSSSEQLGHRAAHHG